jgi:hypothetical protein
MGIEYRAHLEKQIVFVVWNGVVTADEWFEHIQVLITDPLWPSISAMLVDLHSITDLSAIEEAEIEHAVALFNSVPDSLSNKRVAVVAGNAFWKSRRFGQLISPFGPSVIVFNDLSTACLYLGIKSTDASKALQELRADSDA